MQGVLRPQLIGMHLVRRRALLRHKDAPNEGAISNRQKSLGNDVKKISRPQQADDPYQNRNPTLPQEKPKRAAVEIHNSALDPSDHALHPGSLCAFTTPA